ncbi:hypothetical protein HanIR_Chr15g0774951 [Helianthus annuus]|nr:hypothetical protein HanIR_Chr15g0774951 [Helianthus annuus]
MIVDEVGFSQSVKSYEIEHVYMLDSPYRNCLVLEFECIEDLRKNPLVQVAW